MNRNRRREFFLAITIAFHSAWIATSACVQAVHATEPPGVAPIHDKTTLWLKVGETRALSVPRSGVVRVGSRSVLRVVDSAKGIQLIGLRPGTTSLVAGDRVFQVRVSLSSQKDFALALRESVKAMLGLRLSLTDTKIEVDGTLLRFTDWLELAEVAKRYDGSYEFRARPLPDVGGESMAHFRDLMESGGYPLIRFTYYPRLTAHLPQAAGELASAVQKAFKPYGIAVEMSNSELRLEPLIKTRVILAEVERSFERDFGFKWPGQYQAQILPRLRGPSGGGGGRDAPEEASTLNMGDGDQSLMLTLKALEQKGKAQILASPNLLCRSGGEAHFHAGGEFPIRVIGRRSQDVIWKNHGVMLRVKPKADFHGALSLELETEVSMLDSAHAVDGIPALKVNSVRSHFDLPGKRTIALSGLMREEMGGSREGLPWLSGLPILGPLFSSRQFQSHQSELVIFVTPEVSAPQSVTDDRIEMPKGWVRNETDN